MTRRHTDFSEQFLGYIAQRELRYARCRKTGAALGYTACLPSEKYEWVEASGNATLYSFVIYHQNYNPDFPTPYNVALVELEEGPQLVSTVIINDLFALKVGMKLRAEFETSGRLVFMPI